MRIFKIELPATFQSVNPDIVLGSNELSRWLFQELEGLRRDIVETIRARVAAYFPSNYEVFVRLQLEPDDHSVRVIIWIDDPNISWPAGLLARRAWSLSIPILAYVVADTFSEKLEHVELKVDETKTHINAFAPARFWKDPLVLTMVVATLATLYWVFLHEALVGALQSLLPH
jgi:hypothetical protein